MSEYLQDYLTVIPKSDREEVERILNANKEIYEIKVINEDQFKELIQVLADGVKQVTEIVAQGDKIDAVGLNDFYSSVALDLKNLYQRHLTTETVVANYDRILQGVLEDMKRELEKLRQRVTELDMRAKGEDGLIVKTYGFEEENRGEFMETDTEQYGHLFIDRDGSRIEIAELQKDYHQNYLVLPKTTVTSGIKDANGRITAKLEVIDRRGIAVQVPSHTLSKAIDDSSETYWAEVVYADAPIETSMKKGDANK